MNRLYICVKFSVKEDFSNVASTDAEDIIINLGPIIFLLFVLNVKMIPNISHVSI